GELSLDPVRHGFDLLFIGSGHAPGWHLATADFLRHPLPQFAIVEDVFGAAEGFKVEAAGFRFRVVTAKAVFGDEGLNGSPEGVFLLPRLSGRLKRGQFGNPAADSEQEQNDSQPSKFHCHLTACSYQDDTPSCLSSSALSK